MYYSLKQGLLDSLKKWKYFSERNFTDSSDAYDALEVVFPEVMQLMYECGLCEFYKVDRDGYSSVDCKKCKLGKITGPCKDLDSCYDVWEENPISGNALPILKAIQKIYDDLYS